jgi:hypothetical protein
MMTLADFERLDLIGDLAGRTGLLDADQHLGHHCF